MTFFVITLFFTLNGCEKNQNDLNSVSGLKAELNNLANSNIDGQMELDPCHSTNLYDTWGEALYLAMVKLSQTKSESGNILFTNRNEFEKKLKLELPKEYLHLDTININMKNIESICDEFLSLYIKRNIFEVLQLSKKMETHLIQSTILRDVDKAYILKFVSLIRYLTYFNYTLNSKSENSFESCWISSLRQIENSGFFTRLVCIMDWPVCLGAVAADCLVEQMTS